MAAAKLAFRRVQDGTFDTDQAQRLAQQTAQQVNQLPFGSGRRLAAVTVNTTSTTINHGLGRALVGVIVLRGNGVAGAVGFATAQPTDQTRQANLISTANGSYDLWVF